MGDLYIVDLSLDLPASTPAWLLADLRRHLGEPATDDTTADESPVWAQRGPAVRVGGVLTGHLAEGPRGWSLTVRQEVHGELLPDAEALIERLADHTTTEGLIGQIRFFEDDVPELFINSSGTLTRMSPRA
ncbi:hypothetical protein [Streptomyces sp. NPDC047928]|uniref:hypothetical protein n=1 Tax=unclassified Streptomyces TaxID=2593676 RepID=UPI003711B864